MYTTTQVNELLTGTAFSSAITSAIAGKADKSTTYTKISVNNILQHNTEGSCKMYECTDPNNVYSGGVISHPTRLIFCKTNTTDPAVYNILMRVEDTYACSQVLYTSYHIQIGGMLQTNRTDETLLFKSIT